GDSVLLAADASDDNLAACREDRAVASCCAPVPVHANEAGVRGGRRWLALCAQAADADVVKQLLGVELAIDGCPADSGTYVGGAARELFGCDARWRRHRVHRALVGVARDVRRLAHWQPPARVLHEHGTRAAGVPAGRPA